MNRKSKFILGLSTALLTFGILYATLGPGHFNRGHRGCHNTENCCGHHKIKKCDTDHGVQGQEKATENKAPMKADSAKN